MRSMKKKTIRTFSAVLALLLILGLSMTVLADRSGTVKSDSVNIRSGAGTGFSAVTQLSKGTSVTVTGEETDSAGKIWYAISFAGGNGYIREDFIDVGEEIAPEVPEVPEVPEEPAETMDQAPAAQPAAPSVPKDYTVEYIEGDDGESSWYLNNNIEGVRYKVNDLLEAAEKNDESETTAVKQVKRQKILIGFLFVFLVIAIIAITLLVFRLKGVYEEMEEEHYRNQRARRGDGASSASRTGASGQARAASPRTTAAAAQSSGIRTTQQAQSSRTGVRTEPRTTSASSVRQAPKDAARYPEERAPQTQVRKAAPKPKNFAGDMDDDFEYNFVDLDDDL